MSLTLKIFILAAILLGDVVAGVIILRKLIARDQFPQALIVLVALFAGWIFVAVALFVFV